MSDIFAANTVALYNGTETTRPGGFTSAYPPRWSTGDPGSDTIVAPSATQTKWGTNSLRFTGAAGAYVHTAQSVPPVFTQEAWIRPDGVSGVFAIFGVTTESAPQFAVLQVNAALVLAQGGAHAPAFVTLPAGTLTAATWHHVAWTVNAGKVHTLFLDGTKILSFVSEDVPGANGETKVTVGQNESYAPTYPTVSPFTGYMDDVRLTSVVRYVNDFSAPTGAFDTTPGSSVQGDGASTSVSAVAADAVSRIIRQGTAVSAGEGFALAPITRVRSTTGSAAGVAAAAAESDNDASPPTLTLTLGFAATLEADTVLADTITSAWSVATTQAGVIVLDGALSASPAFVTAWTAQQELNAELFALIRMLGTLPQQNERGLAWVVNTLTGGSSMYEGFAFNSFGKLDTAYIGCKSDGIYVLDGDDDDGTPIQASMSFGKTDMGSPHLQRMIKAYADVASTAPMALKITTGADEFVYVARDFDEALTTQRFDVGRGLEARYFTFEIFNTDGCDFSISNAAFLTNDIMHRRI